MALDGAAFRPPVEHAHRQLDDASVQAHQLVLEPELLSPALARHQFLAFEQRLLEHRLVKLSRPILIGIGQGGLLRRYRHSQVFQLLFTARQTAADFAQRTGKLSTRSLGQALATGDYEAGRGL